MAQAKRQRWTGLVLGGFGILLVAAGCGGGTPTHTTTPAANQSAKSVVVSTAQSAAHGTILVSGNTLYTLKPSQTSCTAACLKIWPALLLPSGATAAQAGPGVDAGKLGTMANGNALQVTYAGQALYYFSEDTGPGQVNGNVTDVWGTWSDVVIATPGAAASGTAAPGSVVPSTAARSQGSSTSSPANGGSSATTAAPSQTATSMAPSTTQSPSSTATTRTTRTTATTAPPTTRVTTTTAPPTTQAPTTTTTVLSGGGGF